MTGFDFSSIIVATGEGEVCGPDGCLPGEEPAQSSSAAQNPFAQQSADTTAADSAGAEQNA